MRPRLAWVSQMAPAAERAVRGLPEEAVFAPALCASLGADCTVFDSTEGALPSPADFDGVVLGGSVGCVHDCEPWRVELTEWARGLGTTPVLGICGGHQLLAHVRDGVVQRGGFPQRGPWPVWLEGLPGGVGLVAQSHQDAVTAVPSGARVWARDAVCVQALRYGPAQWTTQFHPEFHSAVALPLFQGAAVPPNVADSIERGGRLLIAAWIAAVIAAAQR